MKTSPGYKRVPSLSCITTILRLETRKVLAKLSHFVSQGVVTVSTSLVSASKCWDDNYISPRTPQTTPRPPGIFHFLERTDTRLTDHCLVQHQQTTSWLLTSIIVLHFTPDQQQRSGI